MSRKGIRIIGAGCGLVFGLITGTFFLCPIWIILFAVVIAPMCARAMDTRTSPIGLLLFWGVLALLCSMWDGLAAMLMVVLGLLFLGIKTLKKSMDGAAQSKFGENYRYAFLGGNTGIAVDPDRRLVKLKNGSLEQVFAFADVRGWEHKLLSGGQVAGSGHGVLALNLMNADANEKGSGVFVQVRSVDHPVWRIAILDLQEQQRWMEILQQSINEAAAAPSAVGAVRLP